MGEKQSKKPKTSVAEIVTDRLIKKIEEEGKVFWDKPFIEPCMNWYSEVEYSGINKFLLQGGEYITPNQLKKYNEANKTNYWFDKGTPSEIVVYTEMRTKELTEKEKEALEEGKLMTRAKIIERDGVLYKAGYIRKYYVVYNIKYIKDKEGNYLPTKLGRDIEEVYEDVEEVVANYTKRSKVKVEEGVIEGKAFYVDDRVNVPSRKYFKSDESFYRTLFHELAHSTGEAYRLDRQCFKKYHDEIEERGREELVAEVCSVLLATECGFKNGGLEENSLNYVKNWVSWMKGHPEEVVIGLYEAEKAKKYILEGLVESDEKLSDTKI